MNNNAENRDWLQKQFIGDPLLREFVNRQNPPFSVLIDLLLNHLDDKQTGIRYVNHGMSGAGVLLLLPDAKVPKVLKFAKLPDIEKEFGNFERCVKQKLPPDYAAYSFDESISESNGYGCFSYSWAGGYERVEPIRSIVTDIGITTDQITKAVNELMNVLFNWYKPEKQPRKTPFELWKWVKKADSRILDVLVRFQDDPAFGKLVAFMHKAPSWRSKLSVGKFARARQCHGDLTCNNVVISISQGSRLAPRLIDFGRLCKNQCPAYDWAKLERDLKYKCLLDICDYDPIRFGMLLRKVDDFLADPNSDYFSDIEDEDTRNTTQKIAGVICGIRLQYIELVRPCSDLPLTEYLFYVLFWSLAFLDPARYPHDDTIKKAVIGSALLTFNALEESLRLLPEGSETSVGPSRIQADDAAQGPQSVSASNGLPGPSPVRWRRAIWLCAFVVLLAAFGGLWILQPGGTKSVTEENHQARIVVAKFSSPSTQVCPLQESIIAAINHAKGKNDDLAVRGVDRIIREQDPPAVVERFGHEQHADAVVWGFCDSAPDGWFDVHFVPITSLAASLELQVTNIMGPATAMQGYDARARIGGKIGSLAMAILGWSRIGKDPQGAADAFAKALEEPTPDEILDRGQLLLSLATAKFLLLQLDEANIVLEQGLGNKNHATVEADLLSFRAMAEAFLHNDELAISNCSKVITTTSYDALVLCANIYQFMGNARLAKFAWERAAHLHPPSTPQEHLQLARIYSQTCDFPLAEEEIHSAVLLHADSAALEQAQAWLKYHKGDKTAVTLLQPQTAQEFVNRAGIYRDQNQQELSRQDVLRASKLAATPFEWLSVATAFYSLHDLNESLKFYDKVLAISPTSSFVLKAQSIILADLKLTPRALDALDKVIKVHPDDAEAYALRAEVRIDEHIDTNVALKDLHTALHLQPSYAYAYFLEARLAAYQRRFAEAIRLYSEAIDLVSNVTESYFDVMPLQDACYDHQLDQRHKTEAWYRRLRAEAAIAAHDFALATRDLDLSKTFDPTNPAVFYVRSQFAEAQGDIPKAISELDTVIGLRKDAADYVRKGDLLLRVNDPNGAMTAYGAATKIDSHSVGSLEGEASVYKRQGDWKNAEHTYALLLQQFAKDPYYLSQHGFALHRLQRSEEGLKEINAALAIKPDLRDAINDQAIVYCEIGKFKEAFKYYGELIALAPSDAFFRSNEAACLERAGDYQAASQDYLVAARSEASNPERWRDLAHIEEKLENYKAAVAAYTHAISLKPDDSTLYMERGQAISWEAPDFQALRSPKPSTISIAAVRSYIDRALTDIDHAISLNPANSEYRRIAASMCGRAAYDDKAISYVDDAIKIDPQNSKLYLERAWSDKSKTEQITDYSRSLQIQETAIAYQDRGLAYETEKDFVHAVNDLTNAIRLAPQDTSLYHERARVYEEMNRLDDAIKDLDELFNRDQSVESAVQKARLHQKEGRGTDAFKDLERAMEVSPNRFELYEARGNLYYLAGNTQAAVKDYVKAAALLSTTAHLMREGLPPNDPRWNERWTNLEHVRLDRKAREAGGSKIDLNWLWFE